MKPQKFDFDQISTYLSCPLKYKFAYVDKLPNSAESSNKKFSEAIHRVMYYYLYNLMNGTPVSNDKLRDKWQESWFEGITVQDVLFSTKKEKTDLGYKGLGMIHQFYREFSNNPGFIIAVDMKMDDVPIGNYLIDTHLELIREVQEGSSKLIELVDLKTGFNYPDDWMAQNDLRLTMQSYAFRKIFNAKEQRDTYWFLRNGKQIYTVRGNQQYKRLASTVDAVAKNVQDGLFYPRETPACKTCRYRNICSQWPA